MKNLIEALTIFSKYADLEWPTHCEHDVMYIIGITREQVSDEDHAKLEELGFIWSDSEDGCYLSFRFGSA